VRTSRPGALAALLVTAIASGAVAGVLTACFLWLVQGGERYFWTTLPDRVGVDPYGSWWLYAIPLAGGVLVGLGHRYLGNYPEPIQDVVQRWKAGGHVEPRTVPASVYSSLSALVTGGPVGFEAALTGLIGGVATWIGRRIGAVGRLVREAWGAERVDGLPRAARNLPYWLAAVGGLFAYKWLPFGQLDADFRFTRAQIGRHGAEPTVPRPGGDGRCARLLDDGDREPVRAVLRPAGHPAPHRPGDR
jgi:hypothetical protein